MFDPAVMCGRSLTHRDSVLRHLQVSPFTEKDVIPVRKLSRNPSYKGAKCSNLSPAII
jgi:hypothetical protein